STETERVVQLVKWLNQNVPFKEMNTVRAIDLLEARAAACEVHGLAIAILKAFGIRARWICGAKSSFGFGYVEAFVDGRWRLFHMRHGDDIVLDKSALELFHESEPSLSVRTYYRKPGASLRAWNGSAYPVLFPLYNLRRHPELEPLF